MYIYICLFVTGLWAFSYCVARKRLKKTVQDAAAQKCLGIAKLHLRNHKLDTLQGAAHTLPFSAGRHCLGPPPPPPWGPRGEGGSPKRLYKAPTD